MKEIFREYHKHLLCFDIPESFWFESNCYFLLISCQLIPIEILIAIIYIIRSNRPLT